MEIGKAHRNSTKLFLKFKKLEKIVALNLEQKKAIVVELSNIAQKAISAVAADYRGLTVSQMSQLRKIARNAGVIMRVYRNTLARRAFKETPYACFDKVLTGPIVLFFSQEEPGAAARLIEKFVKEHEQLEVKALVLERELLPADKLQAVAQLPSREGSFSQLVVVLLAPVTKFVSTLNEPIVQLVRVVAALQDQKKAA